MLFPTLFQDSCVDKFLIWVKILPTLLSLRPLVDIKKIKSKQKNDPKRNMLFQTVIS